MPRNGNAVTTKTEEPNELYDSLSQEGQDTWDAIGALGYTPEQGGAGLWWARKTGSKHAATVGPIDSLSALLPAVRDEIAEEAKYPQPESNVHDFASNGNGRVKQPYLPGAEDIEELDQQADICLAAQDEQQLAKSNFTEAKDEMKRRLKAHGRTNYKRGGWNMTIKNNEILELKQDKNRSVSDQPLEADPDSEASQVVDPEDMNMEIVNDGATDHSERGPWADLMKQKQAAVYAGVSEMTIFRARKAGELSYVQLRGQIYLTRAMLDEWLQRSIKNTKAAAA